MIFRTITDDISGAIKSIGLFGLSLQNVRNIVNNIPTKGLKDALFSTPTIDLDKRTIKLYNQNIERCIPTQEALAIASRNTNKETIALIKSANGAIVTTEQLTAAQKASTIAAKAQSAALKGVSIAANLVAYALIAKGIEAAITAIGNYVHRAEYAIKAMEETQEENASSQSDLRESSSTISENRERFLELSKGVDRFSNNVSLSDEDYAEYLDISNQIAALSPSLIQSYDEQGNALLRLGDNAKATGDILDQVLETEQDVAQQTMIDNMGKVADGVYHQVDEARKNIKELENELQDASFYEGISMPEHLFEDVNENTKMIRLDTSTGFTQEQIDELKNVVLNSGARAFVDEFGNSISFYAGDTDLVEKAISDYYSQINETQRKEAEARVNGIKEDIRKEENSIQNAYAQMNSSLSAWAKSTYEYDFLNESQQDLIDALIPSLDWAAIQEETGKAFASNEEYEEYIKSNILDPLMSIPDKYQEDVNQKFSQLLAFEAGDINIIDYVTELQDYLDALDISIDLTPLLGDTEKVREQYKQLTGDFAQQFSESDGQNYKSRNYGRFIQEYSELDRFARENSINTEAEITLWEQCLKESETREQAMEKYLEQSSIHTIDFDSTSFLESALALQSGYDTLLSAQEEYNECGAITASTLQSLMENDLLQYLQYTADGLTVNTTGSFT